MEQRSRTVVVPCSHFQIIGYEFLQSVQVLAIQLDVIVTGALHPQRLYSSWTTFEDGQTMRVVNHVVLRPVDDQNWRINSGHFVNTERKETLKLVFKRWNK